MEFGVHLPHVGPFATPDAIAGVARKAEELGYHSVWVSDHIITPRSIDSPYPGGRYPVQPEWPYLEPVATLLFAAAVTKRVRLGTSVIVITSATRSSWPSSSPPWTSSRKAGSSSAPAPDG